MSAAGRAVAAALARAAAYRVLAAAFVDPAGPRLADLAARAARVAAAPGLAGALRAPLAALAAAAAAADVAAVAAEHARLFARQVACSPYEGAYAPASLAGKGSRLADVAGFYAAFGVTPAAWRPETEDHVAAELEFMAALALKEAYALAEGHPEGAAVTRAAAVAFLTDHLGAWAAAFAAALAAESATPYWHAVAAALAAWIAADVHALGARPAPFDAAAPAAPEPDAFTCPLAPGAEGPAPFAQG
jgi:TorA maturation chaperone TorD